MATLRCYTPFLIAFFSFIDEVLGVLIGNVSSNK